MDALLNFLSQIKPETSYMFLVWILFLGGGVFVVTRVWPWFTTVYFPAKQKQRDLQIDAEIKREERETDLLTMIRDAIVEIRSFMRLMAKREIVDSAQKEDRL